MHVPPMYRPPREEWGPALIRANPLATLVTVLDGAPIASHVPVVIRAVGEDGSLTLAGHMNRINPQWQGIGDGCTALLVFTGPHSYISPTLYNRSPAAPTWNFAAVHASGALTPLPPGPATLGVVTDTVTEFEARFGDGWRMDSSIGYFEQLVSGVGAFTVEVDLLRAMYKLSQEKDPATRENVAAACGTDLAAMMRACLGLETGNAG